MHDSDPELGWSNKAGSYVLSPYTPGLDPIRATFRSDGTRTTGTGNHKGKQKLLFVGGSYTQGWAISDHETFPWRLQEQFPSLHVINHGTGAYGTYQSLLTLERVFSQPEPPHMVFYGFIESHEKRNVAHPKWLRMLALFSKRGTISLPYCTLDAHGHLTRHPTIRHPEWPLREYLATVSFLEEWYSVLRARRRAAQRQAVTEQLLLEMNRLSQQHGARFSVVLLEFSQQQKAHYTQFLARHGIDFTDCVYPLDPGMQVSGEGHPNGKMNARWATCIATKLRASNGKGQGVRSIRWGDENSFSHP